MNRIESSVFDLSISIDNVVAQFNGMKRLDQSLAMKAAFGVLKVKLEELFGPANVTDLMVAAGGGKIEYRNILLSRMNKLILNADKIDLIAAVREGITVITLVQYANHSELMITLMNLNKLMRTNRIHHYHNGSQLY